VSELPHRGRFDRRSHFGQEKVSTPLLNTSANPDAVAQMKRHETATAAWKDGAIGLRPAPLPMTAAGRLFGLNVGDWSMIVIGLLLSGLLMTLA
jgi:hypothetical protein